MRVLLEIVLMIIMFLSFMLGTLILFVTIVKLKDNYVKTKVLIIEFTAILILYLTAWMSGFALFNLLI